MRSIARETVFKFIFSQLFNPSDEGLFNVLLKEARINGQLNDDDVEFARDLLDKIVLNKEIYLDKIDKYSVGYNLSRIFNADKCALLIGICELDNYKQTPIPVVLDEAVKLASKFSTEKSADFVNGILARYVKEELNG